MAKKRFVFDLCLSSKCNRFCSHCSLDADMNGEFFSLENAEILSREICGFNKLVNVDVDVFINLTGKGEAFLNPQMVQILDSLMLKNPDLCVALITSGVNPESFREVNLLSELLNKSYLERIEFVVSFNLFQKDFPRRFIYTLDQLYQKVANVYARVSVPFYPYKTIKEFDDLITKHFSRYPKQLSPLTDEDDCFFPLIKEEELSIGVPEFARSVKKTRKHLVDVRIDENINELEFFFLLFFPRTLVFQTEAGERMLIFSPTDVLNMGRAKGKDFSVRERNSLCSFLGSKEKDLYLDADGYFYPYVFCPKEESLCLGHLNKGIVNAIYKQVSLKEKLFKKVITDTSNRDICDICTQGPNLS